MESQIIAAEELAPDTLGQVIAPIVVSSIVVATGGYFLVFPIAIAAVMVGAVVIPFIKK
ncbi:hypothetical protein [Bifidobacterium dentium]|uniref:hypothetical protein n=1 Tax=Bifidobacterium dentium TaxID=1689 RepID=UPI003D166A43